MTRTWRYGAAALAAALGSTAVPLIASATSVVHPHNSGAPTGTIGVSLPPGYTLLAELTHGVSGYASPGGAKVKSVPATWHDERLVMPVRQVKDGYYDVRLPGRPNGSTTWVKESQVTTGATPYQILINLKKTHLQLFYKNKQIMYAPVGVGTPTDPTPTGRFFVAFYAAPPKPNPGYGPFIMVTSAHSNVITDWSDSGDAMVAIHGPLGDTAEIGTTGARISHGCIRVPVKYQVKLSVVPVGTPIVIFN
jgi:lipoprotein-anchoring transpeptidase ErfK/SrfK